MKYKVGDVVRVRSRLFFHGTYFSPNMRDYCGMCLTISGIDGSTYTMHNVPFRWTEEMFEPYLTPGKRYWVSDESEKAALNGAKIEFVFVLEYNGRRYFAHPDDTEHLTYWKYAVPVEQPVEYFIIKKQGGEVTETKLTDKQREELGI